MKKTVILFITILVFVCGCGKKQSENMINVFNHDVNNAKSYRLVGKMNIYGDEDTFNYDLEAYYLKDNYYKVLLINTTNNHKQIILRNDDGVYVITPSLNKSFKFDSVWPDNSSQSYLLKSLVKDINNDSSSEYSKDNDGFIIKSSVNYPNNSDLKYQKIYFDNNKTIKRVEVYNEQDQIKIEVDFSEVDLNANLSQNDFLLNAYIDEETKRSCDKDSCEKTTGALEDIIYPLYVPTNTYLSGSDKINNEDTERIILTFGGDKNFVIIEENSSAKEVFETIPIYGDPLMINGSVGALGTNSIYWASNGIDYYLVSNDLTTDELVLVASSLNSSMVVSSSK